MATAIVTYHGSNLPYRYSSGHPVGVVPVQIGAREDLDFTAAAAHGDVQEKPVVAMVMSDTDCGIGITDSETAMALSLTRPIKANIAEAIMVPAGMRLGIIVEA